MAATPLLDGRTVIVTGAGRGLGAKYAIECGADGANVIVSDLAGHDEVAELIRNAGGQALAFECNVTDHARVRELIEFGVSSFKAVHAVVNNAGITRDRPIFNMSEADWDAVIATHLKGAYNFVHHLSRYWREEAKEAGGMFPGRIVNITSDAGMSGNGAQSNYGAAKAGLALLPLIWEAELGKYGIRANAVAPLARTPMTDEVGILKEMMKTPDDGSFDVFDPDNVAPLIAWLVSDDPGVPNGEVFRAAGNLVWPMHHMTSDEPIRNSEMSRFTARGVGEAIKERFQIQKPERENLMDVLARIRS